ncbi:putative enoyl-CoA hydratase 1 [Comamonadaceae bacterium OS-1]|nr:putative enoyl-CoA hydratase 1 [Comamonadaceae bacterium OS-1]
MRTFDTFAALAQTVGQEIAVSEWSLVTQQQVDQFADATGDHQWIHRAGERANAGPFGGPIAHGFLTLALLPRLLETSFTVAEARMAVNYGLNKVRFITPVPVGSRVRARLKLLDCSPLATSGVQITLEATIALEGHPKPACVAESLLRFTL